MSTEFVSFLSNSVYIRRDEKLLAKRPKLYWFTTKGTFFVKKYEIPLWIVFLIHTKRYRLQPEWNFVDGMLHAREKQMVICLRLMYMQTLNQPMPLKSHLLSDRQTVVIDSGNWNWQRFACSAALKLQINYKIDGNMCNSIYCNMYFTYSNSIFTSKVNKIFIIKLTIIFLSETVTTRIFKHTQSVRISTGLNKKNKSNIF